MSHLPPDHSKRNGFDPLAYIESAFSDTKREQIPPEPLDVEVTTIGQFLRNGSTEPAKNGAAVLEPVVRNEPKKKFRKTALSAPRPRRAQLAPEATVEPELEEIWYSLPRNIQFLSTFFDDSVTANYYRGEFKESRQELIRRLLDPELTLEEVSRLLGVCPATVRRYTNRGWLHHYRTQGGQRRFHLSHVVKFVEEHGRHPEE